MSLAPKGGELMSGAVRGDCLVSRVGAGHLVPDPGLPGLALSSSSAP